MSHLFAAVHFTLHQAAAVFWLIEDWDHHGRTSTGISQIAMDQQSSWDVTEAANSISGQLSQLEQLGGIQGWMEPADVSTRSLSALGGPGHWKSLFLTGKNANSSWKGGQDKPSGQICHLRSKNQQSPTWFESSFPIFPGRSFQWLTGVSNIPLLMEREGN